MLKFKKMLKAYNMKKDIHPDYVECEVVCACGNKFQTKSNKAIMKIDICSSCHPFFTGEQKLVDSAGRVEKFKMKYKK
jgi:large subunit ribosomal protein L31